MASPLDASRLLRALELDVDGPARWGAPASSSAPGVFLVEIADPPGTPPIDIVSVRRWLERVPTLTVDGERPTETTLARRLARFWVGGHGVLYVGRTAKTLSGRVASLYRTELGHGRPHPGGHWLHTLKDVRQLRVWWAETDAAEEYEDAIIGAWADDLPADERARLAAHGPVLPWANRSSPSLGARDDGIEGALLAADATPAPVTAVKRSEKGRRTSRRSSTTSTRATTSRSRKTATPPPSGRDRPTPVTAEGMAALESELERLTTVERPAVIERVKNARELGDLRENADYEAARNEQSFLEGSIQALEEKIRTAVVIAAGGGSAVALGSTVRFELDGEPGELMIVGSTESDPTAGRISAASPVGKALLGRRAGDEVVVRTPKAEMRYRIDEVA